ncbi:MAG: AMP-binding protein [Candidatus Accumulibacter phosphatis]|uniref:AMP-binding protein n=1 Tax=Candidatus Accumulibacter phosphatis TaxID=327160 RepID=UPI001A5DDBBA|nr:AMP-binding protein [Candidatus Accumulibacter phosphatis]
MHIDNPAGTYEDLCRKFRWHVPERFNIGVDVCGRWAGERSRFALYYEDESGFTSAHTFWDIQRAANRLSNVLAALGTLPGDRVAILLPQCPEAAIAHVAIYQMGALSVPLSLCFGSSALAYRLAHSGAHVAIVDAASLPKLPSLRDRLSELRHVIGVGGAAGKGVKVWAEVLEHASPRYTPVLTAAEAPAMILYGDAASEEPAGALMAHRTLLGNLSGYVCTHDFFPQPHDLFWSPADWASSAGLWGALLPTWHFGEPLLAYNGPFDAAKALALIEKYGVRNTFLAPTALQAMMMEVPEPATIHDLDLRTLTSAGGPRADALVRWVREKLNVGISETFGRIEMNAVVGHSAGRWPAKPGALGRPFPGHRVAVVDHQGTVLPPGEVGQVAVHRRCYGEDDPVMMLGYWRNPAATAAKFVGDGWGLTGDLGRMDDDGYLWCEGPAGDVFNM